MLDKTPLIDIKPFMPKYDVSTTPTKDGPSMSPGGRNRKEGKTTAGWRQHVSKSVRIEDAMGNSAEIKGPPAQEAHINKQLVKKQCVLDKFFIRMDCAPSSQQSPDEIRSSWMERTSPPRNCPLWQAPQKTPSWTLAQSTRFSVSHQSQHQ